MLRSSLFTVSSFALVAGAAAQTAQSPALDTPTRITSPVKFAGTYHVESGTFTRGAAGANFGSADAIYTNTADTPYFTTIIGPTGSRAGGSMTDSGGIPGTSNTNATVSRDDNLVTGFNFAYCDFDAAILNSEWEISFYTLADPCTSVVGLAAASTVLVDGIPAGGCWAVNVDLTGGSEFCLAADGGDGVFDDDIAFDSFAWSCRYTGTGIAAAGPIAASDPSATDNTAGYINPNGPNGGAAQAAAPAPTAGSATYYNPLSDCTGNFNPAGLTRETGSGFFSQDFAFVEDLVGGGVNNGCFYFGGYFNSAGACGNTGGTGNAPYYSWYMEIEATGACGSGIISSPTACPATNNTTGAPGACEVEGNAVASANDVVLRASGLPTSPSGVFGIFLHGLNDLSASPIFTGQGALCIGAPGRFDQGGQIQQANAQGIAELSTTAGQFSLTTLPIATSPFLIPAMTGVTSYFGFWHRDFVTPAASAFNFTGTCSVLWQ